MDEGRVSVMIMAQDAVLKIKMKLEWRWSPYSWAGHFCHQLNTRHVDLEVHIWFIYSSIITNVQ